MNTVPPIAEQELFKLCSNPDSVDFKFIKRIPSDARVGNSMKTPEPNVKYFGDTVTPMRNDGYFAIVSSRSEQNRTDLIKSIIESQKEYISGGMLVSLEIDPLLENVFPSSCVHRNTDMIRSEKRVQKIIQLAKEAKEKGTPIYPIVVLNYIAGERKFLQESCHDLIYNARHLGIKFIVSVQQILEISRRIQRQAQYVFTNELDKETFDHLTYSEDKMNYSEFLNLRNQLVESRNFARIESKSISLSTIPSFPDVVTMGNKNFWYLHYIFAKEDKISEKLTSIFDKDLKHPPTDWQDTLLNITNDIVKEKPKEGENLLSVIAKLMSKPQDPSEYFPLDQIFDVKEESSEPEQNVSQEFERLLELIKTIEQDNKNLHNRCGKYRKENEALVSKIIQLNEKLDRIHLISKE